MSSNSTTVDNRIVEMQFNNAQSENGVSESMSTLDKLKKALNMDSADSIDTPVVLPFSGFQI